MTVRAASIWEGKASEWRDKLRRSIWRQREEARGRTTNGLSAGDGGRSTEIEKEGRFGQLQDREMNVDQNNKARARRSHGAVLLTGVGDA